MNLVGRPGQIGIFIMKVVGWNIVVGVGRGIGFMVPALGKGSVKRGEG